MKTHTFLRKIDEEILIGDDIRIRIIEVKGRDVRVAVTAPREIQVDRKEIREARGG